MPRVESAHRRPDGSTNVQHHPPGVHIYPEADIKIFEETITTKIVFRGPVFVDSFRDYLLLGPIGSRSDYLTITFRPEVRITTGCFSGTIEEFEEELLDKPEGPTREEYKVVMDMLKSMAWYRSKA